MDEISHRCSICNHTNSDDIASNPEDYVDGLKFVPDPDNSLFYICLECAQEISYSLQEFGDDEDEETSAFEYDC